MLTDNLYILSIRQTALLSYNIAVWFIARHPTMLNHDQLMGEECTKPAVTPRVAVVVRAAAGAEIVVIEEASRPAQSTTTMI